MKNVHVVSSWVLYLGTLFFALFSANQALELGYSEFLVLPTVTISYSIFLAFLQKLWPYEKHTNIWPHVIGADLIYGALTFTTVVIMEAFFFTILYAVAAFTTDFIGFSFWPSSLPIAIQLIMALIIGDFGAYWLHRYLHSSRVWWPFHEFHHSSEELYFLSSARNHPVNLVMVYVAQFTPIILLGATPKLLFFLSLFTGIHGLIQHANIDLRMGSLNKIFATIENHRVHHSKDIDISNSNYGSNLIIWDLVFDTWTDPEKYNKISYGLSSSYPKKVYRQLALPFKKFIRAVTVKKKKSLI